MSVGSAVISAPAIWTLYWAAKLPARFWSDTVTGCVSR